MVIGGLVGGVRRGTVHERAGARAQRWGLRRQSRGDARRSRRSRLLRRGSVGHRCCAGRRTDATWGLARCAVGAAAREEGLFGTLGCVCVRPMRARLLRRGAAAAPVAKPRGGWGHRHGGGGWQGGRGAEDATAPLGAWRSAALHGGRAGGAHGGRLGTGPCGDPCRAQLARARGARHAGTARVTGRGARWAGRGGWATANGDSQHARAAALRAWRGPGFGGAGGRARWSGEGEGKRLAARRQPGHGWHVAKPGPRPPQRRF